jgi:molecular chaperone GrpE
MKDETATPDMKKKAAGDANEKLEMDNGQLKDEDTGDINEVVNESNPVESLQNDINAEREKYLRLAAEYDNFRKRNAKEREMIYATARTDAISKLLPVYDNLERALRMECADKAFYKGVEMIMTQLTEVLGEMGVKEIPAVGEQFDPNLHNAVMKIENPELGENTIAEEYQKGFILGDRVIRFSTVVVAN